MDLKAHILDCVQVFTLQMTILRTIDILLYPLTRNLEKIKACTLGVRVPLLSTIRKHFILICTDYLLGGGTPTSRWISIAGEDNVNFSSSSAS